MAGNPSQKVLPMTAEQSLASVLKFNPIDIIGDRIPWPEFGQFLDRNQFIDLAAKATEFSNAMVQAQHTILDAKTKFNSGVLEILSAARKQGISKV